MLNPSVIRQKQSTIFKEQEEKKTRKYLQRVLDAETGSFTPLVFGTNSEMKIMRNIIILVLRSVYTRLRGSRTPFPEIPQGDFIGDCPLNINQACVS